jgi:hypothetical protein
MRYMDVWTWEELESCRAGVFPDIDPDESKVRYDRYGLAGCLYLHRGTFTLEYVRKASGFSPSNCMLSWGR